MGTIGGHPVRFLCLDKERTIGNLGEGAGGKPGTKGGRLRLGMWSVVEIHPLKNGFGSFSKQKQTAGKNSHGRKYLKGKPKAGIA